MLVRVKTILSLIGKLILSVHLMIGTQLTKRDVTAFNRMSNRLEPLRKYHGHTGQINVSHFLSYARTEIDLQDVDWHYQYDYMFASVGDDCQLNVYVDTLPLLHQTDFQMGHT